MASVEEVRLPLLDADGQAVGTLTIALLPNGKSSVVPILIDSRGDAVRDDDVAEIQLLEGAEYRYEWQGLSNQALEVEPVEAFQPDTRDGRTGRIRPGLYTGSMRVTVRQCGTHVGGVDIEVRSRKLNYLDEYRWMLSDIADQMTELVMDRFAASSTRFVTDESRDARTLYQRFAFLQALIASESFQVALNEIVRRPHVAWEELTEAVRPEQPIRGNGSLVRQLSRPGTRVAWPGGPMSSIPHRIESIRTEATHDTTPNRFVRFALERWRQVVSEIEQGLLAGAASSPADRRGLREVAQVLAQLDEVLHHDLFRELGPLSRFPGDDLVLQKREGYRDVFRAYLEFELAAKLSWQGGDSVYGAGQRDVATLYEYWVFLQLAQTVAGQLGGSFDMTKLIELKDDGLNVVLKSGREIVLTGEAIRHGRKLTIDLCFNRTFSSGRGLTQHGSWSLPMRPDYTIIVSPSKDEAAAFEPVLVHFDAKYRVHMVNELFGHDEDLGTDVQSDMVIKRTGALRADVLKMHAYRDAIRRSAGAYVLYPGDDQGKAFPEYHELLPGLGAFALRPTAQGPAAGVTALSRFISDILSHVAIQLTAHERSQAELAKIYESSVDLGHNHLLRDQPPGSTSVLLGWVKSKEHWDWIRRHQSYNVRASGRHGGKRIDEPLLSCQMLLLYGPGGLPPMLARIISDPTLVKEASMLGSDYPAPNGDYLCVEIRWMNQSAWLEGIDAMQLDALASTAGAIKGEPVMVSWQQIRNVVGRN
jgi:uncharacterized protein